MLPDGWRDVKLGDVCDFQEGYVNPSQKVPEYFGSEVKWIRANDLNNGYVFDTTKKAFEKRLC
ncbi:MAG: restriction endonuclease subunit S [Syntrophomonadaceae bacterium]|nr:restriction endonuclease subunit S [Syntrophomonadaceae bacterium]